MKVVDQFLLQEILDISFSKAGLAKYMCITSWHVRRREPEETSLSYHRQIWFGGRMCLPPIVLGNPRYAAWELEIDWGSIWKGVPNQSKSRRVCT